MVTLDRFNGDNPAAWVLQAEQYFSFYNIFPQYQVSIASFYLDGEALDWYRLLFRNQQLASWDNFVDKLLIRFPNRIREAPDLQEVGSEILRQLAELRDALIASAMKSMAKSALEDARDTALPAPLPHLDDEFSNEHSSVDVVLDDNSETQLTQVTEELNKVIPLANIIFPGVTQPQVSTDEEDNSLDNVVDKVFDICSEGQTLAADVANTKQLWADFKELPRISDCHVTTFTTQCILPNFPFDPGSNQLFDESPQQTNHKLCIDKEAMRIPDLMNIEGFVIQNVSRNVQQANIVAMEFYFPIKSILSIALVDLTEDIGKLEFPFGTTSNDQLFLTNFPFDPGDDLRHITCGLSLVLGEWDPGLHFKTLPLKSHKHYELTLPLLGLFGKFCSFVSLGSMTKVWDPGRQWYMHSCTLLCELPLVVCASSTSNYCYTQLELYSPITDKHKKNSKGLFVFPLWWMNLVQNFGWWHILIDACASESNDITRLELSLSYHGYSFCSFYSFNKILEVALGSDCEILSYYQGPFVKTVMSHKLKDQSLLISGCTQEQMTWHWCKQ